MIKEARARTAKSENVSNTEQGKYLNFMICLLLKTGVFRVFVHFTTAIFREISLAVQTDISYRSIATSLNHTLTCRRRPSHERSLTFQLRKVFADENIEQRIIYQFRSNHVCVLMFQRPKTMPCLLEFLYQLAPVSHGYQRPISTRHQNLQVQLDKAAWRLN
jgi:hypothetical protein